jgi:hypothetical protein
VSDAFRDILLDNEQILWSGAPDYSRAAPHKLGPTASTVVWAIILTIALVAMIWAALTGAVPVFVQGVFGVLGVVAALVLFLIVQFWISGRKMRPNERYTLTNLRLMVTNDEAKRRQSYFADSLLWFDSFPNGEVRDLSLMMAQTDEEYVILRALADAASVEKLLIQHGIARRPKS